MTATDRAEIRQILAAALGQGHRVGRADILADLDGWRERTGRAPRRQAAPTAAPAEPAPVAAPDRPLTVAEAATLLGGLSERTVRRYLAPSDGRLARLDGGVSAASLTAYITRRAEAIRRTRWVASPTRRAA